MAQLSQNGWFSLAANSTGQIPIVLGTEKSQATTNYSIEMVIKLPAFECGKVIDLGPTDQANAFTIRQSPTNKNDLIFSFKMNRSGDYTFTNAAIDMHEVWTHIIITYNGTSKLLSLYKNGIFFGSITTSTTTNSNWAPTYIAYSTPYTNLKQSEAVKICMFRSFNMKLTQTYVTQLYGIFVNNSFSISGTSLTIDSTIISNTSAQWEIFCYYGTYNQSAVFSASLILGYTLNLTGTINLYPDNFCSDNYYNYRRTILPFTNAIISNKSSYVILPTSVTVNPKSFSMWIKLYSLPTSKSSIFSITPSNSNVSTSGIALTLTNSDLSLTYAGTEILNSDRLLWIDKSLDFKLNKWMLFTFVINSSTPYFYINDLPIGIGSGAAAFISASFTGNGMLFGSSLSYSGFQGFEGELGPMYMFNKAMTRADVYNLYNNNITTGIAMYLSLYEGTGTSLYNELSIGSSGTLSDATVWTKTA